MTIIWHSLESEHFRIYGLPWFKENKGQLVRLPLKQQDAVPPAVWAQSLMPSGARIRITSNTTTFCIKASHTTRPPMLDMSPMGHSGIDIYIGLLGSEKYWGTSEVQLEGDPTIPYSYTFFQGLEKEFREITLYLPTYNDLTLFELGMDSDAEFHAPSSFSCEKPIVFYGSSITQGGCASRPGNGYAAVVTRNLGVDMVNLGFSGNGKGELFVSSLLAEIDASCYILDFHVNLPTVEALTAVYWPFYRYLRAQKPDTPIVMISPIRFSSERYDQQKINLFQEMRQLIRTVYDEALSNGDTHLYYVHGPDLLDLDMEGAFVDGLHPNDLGFQWMAKTLEPILGKILRLQ